MLLGVLLGRASGAIGRLNRAAYEAPFALGGRRWVLWLYRVLFWLFGDMSGMAATGQRYKVRFWVLGLAGRAGKAVRLCPAGRLLQGQFFRQAATGLGRDSAAFIASTAKQALFYCCKKFL